MNTTPANTKKKSSKKLIVLVSILCVLALGSGFFYYQQQTEIQKQNEQLLQAAAQNMTLPDIPSPLVDLENFLPNSPEYESDRTFTLNESEFSEKILRNLKNNVKAQYVVLYDLSTDEILFEKNSLQKCYPASTTKLLTAVVACRIINDPGTVITVGNEIEMIGEESSTAGLEKGMMLTFEMLMDALMLPSGNDAAYTMAVNCARIFQNDNSLSNQEAVELFVKLMNDAAYQLGAKDSHFINPDGWHDPGHYTTAQDLAKITAYARSIPLIADSCKKHYVECKLLRGGMLYWVNTNLMLNDYYKCYSPYCDGMKTGFTDEAGTCVIASAVMEGHNMIAVVMDGSDGYAKYDDAGLLFRCGFRLYNLYYALAPKT